MIARQVEGAARYIVAYGRGVAYIEMPLVREGMEEHAASILFALKASHNGVFQMPGLRLKYERGHPVAIAAALGLGIHRQQASRQSPRGRP